MKGIARTSKRRRREAKTDFVARLKLLASRQPRLVIRKTNRYVVAQIVESDIAQDRVLLTVSSKDLIAQGWPEAKAGSLKNISAAYLTGLLLAKKSKVKNAIIDMGMQRNVKKGRIFAVVRGAVEGGMKIPHDASILPDEKTLEKNAHTREAFNTVRKKLEHHG